MKKISCLPPVHPLCSKAVRLFPCVVALAGSALPLIFSLPALMPGSVAADILAYEGFDYPDGAALGGQEGGRGWAAPWTVVHPNGGSQTVISSSLSGAGKTPPGFDAASTGGSVLLTSNYRTARSLDTTFEGVFGQAGYLDANGRIGADGKTLYISFLQQANAPELFYEFELHRDDPGDPGRIAGVGNDRPGGDVNLRVPDGTHTFIGGGDTEVNFFVIRIDFKPDNDDIRVYRNPVSATEPETPDVQLADQADLSFNSLALAAFLNSRQVAHDEVRIGETWADMSAPVTAPPEAPQITLQPQSGAIAYAGGNLQLSAGVSGTPAPSVQWYLGDTPVPGATQATLFLTDIPLSAAGNYRLQATNASGTAESDPAAVTVLTPPDGLIAYEGFAYPEGTANLAGRDEGMGWAGPWQLINNGSSDVQPGSLSAGSAGPSWLDSRALGNKAFLPTNRRDGRRLDTSMEGPFGRRGMVDDNGYIGADGTTLYFSFLQQPDGTSLFYEMEFHRGDPGDGGRIAGIGNDQPGDNVHLRAPNGVHTLIGPGSTEVNFYVVRIDYKSGPDDIRVWQNPGTGGEPETPTLTLTDHADMEFDGLSMGAFVNGRTVTHDELRLGESWEAVVASPYAQWLGAFTFPAGADKTAAGDPDADGLSNLLEYSLGTSPVAASAGGITWNGSTLTSRGLPVLSGPAPAGLQAVFARRRDHAEAGLLYSVEFSRDLKVWQSANAGATVVAADDTVEAVSVPWPAQVPVGSGGNAAPQFFRVAVTRP